MSEVRQRQTSGDSPSSRAGIRSPEVITLRSFLSPITNLDDGSLETLKKLLKVMVNLRQQTHHSKTHRVKRGSPGAHELGASLAQFRSRVDKIAINLDKIVQQHDDIPGMYLIQSQFAVFRETLNQKFNDGGNEGGYFERVQLLEKLMYLTGTLRGHLEVILEQHSYWKAKLAGETPPRIVRRLDFNQAVDPASQKQEKQLLPPAVQLGGAVTNEGELMTAARTPHVQERDTRSSRPSSPKDQSDRKFTININLSQHMQSGITELWESQRHTDVTFIVSSDRVTAHRVILASQSEYFDRLLYGEMREAHAGAEIQLEDTPLQTFLHLLQYAYTGCLEVKDAELPDVLETVRLADRFSFTLLKDALGDQLVGRVSHTNALQILVCADLYHLPRLHDCCLGFIDKNAAKVLENEALLSLPGSSLKCVISRDTLYVPEISIFQALMRWKESNNKSSEQMADFLQYLRLSEISPEQLFSVIEPCGLFDGNTMLDAMRVRFKPELEQMQPRGKTEEGQNLLKSPTATADHPPYNMTSALSLGISFGPPKTVIADTVFTLMPPSDVINPPAQDTIGLGCLNRSGFGRSTGPGVINPSTVTVTLDSLYLINCLKLNAYPDVTTEVKQKSFSYAISISRDNQHWVELFNYCNYTCLATQDLLFPTQAVRSFKFELTGRSDASQEFSVKLASCSFTANQKPFMFRDHGIIAPLSPLTPLATQSTVKTSEDLPTRVMTFNQPYSISMLRFKISGPKSNKGDIMVSVSTEKKKKCFKKIGDLENIEFGTQLTVEFPEQVVSYVMVVIKKTHGEDPPTAPSFTITQSIGTTQMASAPSTAASFKLGMAAPITSASTFLPVQPTVVIPAGLTSTQTTQPSQFQPFVFSTAPTVMTSATKTTPSTSTGGISQFLPLQRSASPSLGLHPVPTSHSTVPAGGMNTATADSAAADHQSLVLTSSSQPQSPQLQPATRFTDLPCLSPPVAAGTAVTFTIIELTCQAGFQGNQE